MSKQTSRKKERRASVGALAHQALKNPVVEAEEMVLESTKDFNKDLEWCVSHALGKEDCIGIPLHNGNCKVIDGDFFIEVFISHDTVLTNVIKSLMIARTTCPTPNYDHMVYHYHANSCDLEYLWNVPSKAECIEIMNYRTEAAVMEPELLQNVIDFFTEVLLAKAKKLNGEVMEPGLLLEKDKIVHSVDKKLYKDIDFSNLKVPNSPVAGNPVAHKEKEILIKP